MKIRKGKIRSFEVGQDGIFIKIDDYIHGRIIVEVENTEGLNAKLLGKEVYFAINDSSKIELFIHADEASKELKDNYNMAP